jgi:MFS family permease
LSASPAEEAAEDGQRAGVRPLPWLQLTLFRAPGFRALSVSGACDWLAATAEQVALGWLTLELTDSPLLVGLALGLRLAPFLLVGIPAGVLADLVDRRTLLKASGAAMAVTTALLAALVLADAIRLWQVLALTFLGGCARAVQGTARQGYAHDLIGTGDLVGGLSLLGLAMRLGGLAGSLAAGGVTARFGVGAGYLLATAGYVGCVAALLPVRAGVRRSTAVGGALGRGLLDAFRVFRGDSLLPGLMVLTAGAEMLGFSHQAVLPSLARDVLAVGAGGLGAMTAARSVGGILGIVAVSGLGGGRGTGRVFLAVLCLFGGSLVALGFAGSLAGVLVLLVVVNGLGAVADILSQSLIQASAPRAQQGRAAGAWVVAIGTAPLGQLQIGAVASVLSVGAAFGVTGAALLLLVVVVAVLVPRLRAG